MRKLVVLLTLVVGLITTASAQNTRTIIGKVSDESGKPLAGVTVTASDLSKTSLTDAKGVYSIQVTDKTKSLKFTFVGYAEEEINIGAKQSIDVNMMTESKALSEVVVVGYGVQQKNPSRVLLLKLTPRNFPIWLLHL